jgi:hypothetical protein
LTKIRRKDEDVVAEALRQLGTSESEGLLYKGMIFVEGEEDIELLEAGFGNLLQRYKIKDLGGRREVEKQIRLLQQAEERGENSPPRYFIFDKDQAPTQLSSTSTIKVLQWSRRCLENYLLDLDILTDLLKDGEIIRKPLANQAEVINLLREVAMTQLDSLVARDVYRGFFYESPGLRVQEIRGKDFPVIADALFARISRLQGQVCDLTESAWKEEFIRACHVAKREIESVWAEKWREDCDAKQLFSDLQQRVPLKLPLLRFKKRVISEMHRAQSEGWQSINSLLKNLVEAKGEL